MPAPLPKFDRPPVVEVALSVQFEALNQLRTPQIGNLWNLFKSEFPTVEEQNPIEPAKEIFDPEKPALNPGVNFRVQNEPFRPRVWFVNADGSQLIQIQSDRFIHNWKKNQGDEKYPSYEVLKSKFSIELSQFSEYLEKEGIGTVKPNQCEVTYINHIFPDSDGKNFGELGKFVTVFVPQYSDSFLSNPEETRITMRHLIFSGDDKKPVGRLHIVAEPAYKKSDYSPLYQLILTARLGPLSEGLEGALSSLDLGREHVVRGFTSITTGAFHKKWGRTDVPSAK